MANLLRSKGLSNPYVLNTQWRRDRGDVGRGKNLDAPAWYMLYMDYLHDQPEEFLHGKSVATKSEILEALKYAIPDAD